MPLQSSLFKTLAFFDLFDYPLTAEEIQKFLYGYTKPVHIKEILGTLNEMPEVESLKDFYFLKGRSELVKIREERQLRAQEYWDKVAFYGLHMWRVPFIRMIAVCNNLSYGNVAEDSDIDLLIVTEPGRMWTARVLLTLLLQFFGVRRHGNLIAKRFCLSFFITTRRMYFKKLELQPEDPYLAYWVALLAPIEGQKTYEELKNVNSSWLKERYGLSFPEEQARHFYALPESGLKKTLEWMLRGRIGNFIEKTLKFFLEKRALRKAARLDPKTSGTVIEDDMLKFHDCDRRREYCEAWQTHPLINSLPLSTHPLST